MKKIKKILFSPAVTVLCFVLAAGLLLFSSISGARAALTYYSETYASRVQMYNIGVTLVENGNDVSWRDYGAESDGKWDEATGELLTNMLKDGESLELERAYKEELNVRNSGSINQYVRVSVFKYWLDENGNKLREFSPELIELNFVNQDNGDWIEDVNARTDERTVLYYSKLLPVGESTSLLTDTLTVSGDVALEVEQIMLLDGTLQTIYKYNGARICVEARVDAVQENNAAAAALSAWGQQVSINPNTKTLRLQ